MAWEKVSLQDLRNRCVNDLKNRLGLVYPVLPTSVVSIFGVVYAGLVYTQHLFLDWVQKQFFVLTCDDSELARHGAELGIYQKAATYSIGLLTATGVAGSSIPQGTVVQATTTKVQYYTQEVYVIGTTDTVFVKSAEYGQDTIISTDTSYAFINTPTGVDTAVELEPATNGADLESGDDFRDRIHYRKVNTPQGGSGADYVAWATAVQPVTDCTTIPYYPNPNSVTCVVANYNISPPVILDTTLVANYIDSRRPVTADVHVVSVVPTDIILDVTISTSSSTIQQDIINNVTELFMLTPAGGIITRENLEFAIRNVAAEYTATLDTITNTAVVVGEINLGYYEIALLDVINFTVV